MDEIQSPEHIFPFQCNTHGCNREYDLERFLNVAQLWGLIFLNNSDHAIVGVTCPDCFQTTVKKYPFQKGYALMSEIEQKGIQLENGYQIKMVQKNFVPFSEKILSDLSLIDNEALQSDSVNEACYVYRIPFGFEPIRFYPELISSEFPYSIDEKFISLLVEIENTKKYKTLPRLMLQQSIYSITDIFLFEMNQLYQTKSEFLAEVNEILVCQIQPIFHVDIYSKPKTQNNLYDHMILDDLTPDEIKNMDLDLTAWERTAFQEGIQKFIREYKILRNQIDFEIVYRKEFLNKWARKFYYDPGYYNQMELEAEDLLLSYEEDLEIADINLFDAGPYPENHLTNESIDHGTLGLTNRLPLDGEVNVNASEIANKNINDSSLSKMLENDLPQLKDIDYAFIRKGAIWYVKFRGEPTTINHSKKLLYITYLLDNPHRHINNLSLVAMAAKNHFNIEENKKHLIRQKNGHSDSEDEGNILNEMSMPDIFKTDDHVTPGQIKTVKQEFKQMLKELKEFEKDKDYSKVEEQKLQIEKFISYADEEFGIRINLKENYEYTLKSFYKLEKEAENARVTVRNNFSNLLKDLSKKLPALERHLLRCIETKTTYAKYNPHKSRIGKSIKWYIR